MSNSEIILQNRIELMKNGIIGSTGKIITITTKDGLVSTIQEPEEIHTVGGWKALGYDIMSGETAVTTFKIWKLKLGTNTMHKVEAAFFMRGQVTPIQHHTNEFL